MRVCVPGITHRPTRKSNILDLIFCPSELINTIYAGCVASGPTHPWRVEILVGYLKAFQWFKTK